MGYWLGIGIIDGWQLRQKLTDQPRNKIKPYETKMKTEPNLKSAMISAVFLSVALATAMACHDRSDPDPTDESASETYSLPCNSNTSCQTTPQPGTCGGTLREQKQICSTVPDVTNKSCTTGPKQVKLKWFTGTCKLVGEDCLCTDKQEIVSQDVTIITCTCVPHTCTGG